MLLKELADVLTSSYDEIIMKDDDGQILVNCEFPASETWHALSADLMPDGMFVDYAENAVQSVDLYYDGDHMVLELTIL